MSPQDQRYHVIAINEVTGAKTYLTQDPCSHHEACVILSKQTPSRKNVRKQLEPIEEKGDLRHGNASG